MDINAMAVAAAHGIMPRRTTTRVKSFTGGTGYAIEFAVNSWLEDQGPAFRLVDVKYLVAETRTGSTYSALVIYTDLEPLGDNKEGNG